MSLPADRPVALVGAVVLTPRQEIANGTVLVRDGRIETVVPAAEALPADALVVNLQGSYLIPGLIDTHIHLLGHRHMDSRQATFVGEALRTARAVADMRRLLDAGFTTVRDCGSHIALALCEAVREGSLDGPDVVGCGRFIEPTGGADDAPFLPTELVQAYGPWGPRLADGPDEIRIAVREQVRAGARWIKTCTTGAITTQEASDPDRTEWTDAELAALISEAHRLGRRVAIHAHGTAGIHQAIDHGADSIEHGTFLDEEAARKMADRGIFLVPTLFVLDRIIDEGEAYGTPAWVVAKARGIQERRRTSFELALRHGVPIALGTDCGGQDLLPHGVNAMEAVLLVQAGMSPAAALSAATDEAARCLGIDHDRGSIAPGKAADLVAVTADPRMDIATLAEPCMVMRQGRIVGPSLMATRAMEANA
jgi:imidazolonepropionase-like amidohydrolase